jgi:hypothetical protein
MTRNEALSRADTLAEVQPAPAVIGKPWQLVVRGLEYRRGCNTQEEAAALFAPRREAVADIILAAVDAARSRHEGAPLDDRQLVQLRRLSEESGPPDLGALREGLTQTLDHIDHLDSILGDLRADGVLAPYETGHRAGRQAERDRCRRILCEHCRRGLLLDADGRQHHLPNDILGRVVPCQAAVLLEEQG